MAKKSGNPRFAPRKLTAEDVARYGHIAATLRLYLDTFNMRPSQMSKLLWPNLSSNSGLYTWTNGYAAPSASRARTIADFMGVPIQYLLERDPNGPPAPALPNPMALRPPPGFSGVVVTTKPENALVLHNAPEARRHKPVTESLSYRSHSDGTATISLNVTLPIGHAKPLFRTLLDSGVDEAVNKEPDE